MTNHYEHIDDFIAGISGTVLVERPCHISKVHSQYLVDIYYYDNCVKKVLFNVPVKHYQSQRAFLYMALKENDKGTVRFFDNDVDGYKAGNEIASTEVRKHDINDNYFDYGFYPNKEQYIMPDRPLCLGLRNLSAVIEFSEDGKIMITGAGLDVNADSRFLGSLTGTKVIALNGVTKDIIDSQGKILATVENGIVVG